MSDDAQGRAEEQQAIDLMQELIGAISNRTGDNLQDWSAYFGDWAKELAPRITAALRAERVQALEEAAKIVETFDWRLPKLVDDIQQAIREQARRAGGGEKIVDVEGLTTPEGVGE